MELPYRLEDSSRQARVMMAVWGAVVFANLFLMVNNSDSIESDREALEAHRAAAVEPYDYAEDERLYANYQEGEEQAAFHSGVAIFGAVVGAAYLASRLRRRDNSIREIHLEDNVTSTKQYARQTNTLHLP